MNVLAADWEYRIRRFLFSASDDRGDMTGNCPFTTSIHTSLAGGVFDAEWRNAEQADGAHRRRMGLQHRFSTLTNPVRAEDGVNTDSIAFGQTALQGRRDCSFKAI